ncbi:hypothetical protein [Actinomadura flavalba]|uniref:hypothetical protein n=1 Tax=Actinomadura flavalba TaxID=1120938 RepID=UPI0003A23FBB|nr:hypothetical protein [Actinomadura flavalba]
MTTTQVLSLLLALSTALNVAGGAAAVARWSGQSVPNAILTGGAAAGAVVTLFLAAVGVYG